MSIAIGSNSVSKIYLGSNEVSKMYLGSDLVWESSGRILPVGYTECDYILTGGWAWINTGIKYKSTMSLYLDAYFCDIVAQNRMFNAKTNTFLSLYVNGSNYWAFSYDNGSASNTSTGVAATTGRHTFFFDVQNKHYQIDGGTTVDYDFSSKTVTGQSSTNLFLFKDSNTTYYGYLLAIRAKIWDGNELIRDYIPAKRDSDGVYGMYDIVNNSFYTSASSYGFSGREKYILPSGYTKAMFVHTTYDGTNNNHITDSNIGTDLSFKVTMDFSLDVKAKNQKLFVRYSNLEARIWLRFYTRNASDMNYAYQYGDTEIWKNTSKSSNIHPQCFKMDSVNEIITINNGSLYTESLSGYTNTHQFTDAFFRISENTDAKYYNCKYWESGTMVANYIPCKDSNNVWGLYNVIGNYFITDNQGTATGELY